MPSLPTDNLYKFLTTLGVTISIFSFWSISEAVKNAGIAVKEYHAAASYTRNNLENWNEVVRSLEEDIKLLSSQIKAAESNQNPTSQDIKLLNTGLIAIRSQLDYVAEIKSEIQSNRELINEKHLNVTVLIEAASSTLRLYRISYYGGALMAIIGFLLWYCRHQKFQDQIVRQQAMSAGSNPA